jgi:uncharacterized protein (DUF1697 family)
MPAYVALLRAVNVGGAGKLAMATLAALCAEAGFSRVRTYIASGNVAFHADAAEPAVKAALETLLAERAGLATTVLVRSAEEMQQVVAGNPFPDQPGNQTAVLFLDQPPPADALDRVTGLGTERLSLGRRELYVLYPDGMGRSRLRIPAAETGTMRNMNTVAKLADMARES